VQKYAPENSAATTADKAVVVVPVLAAISTSHLLNDLIQALVPSLYPLLRQERGLDFGQIGLITLTFFLTSSLFQPLVGFVTDKRPMPYSLAFGMTVSLIGLLTLSRADTFGLILLGAGLIGLGSAVFHPESARVARMASGGRYGLAQSVFQTGGNAGSALGPVLAALIVVPYGQHSVAWFSIVALVAVALLATIGRWSSHRIALPKKTATAAGAASHPRAKLVIGILLVLIFSKFVYITSLTSYYTLYLIDHFKIGIQEAQLKLFVFQGALAVGTILGGPIGDKIGRRRVIWASILGALPFTLILPYVSLFWTVVLTIPIGLILASAFSSMVVYAQELVPGRVGMISGLFFGFAFGMAGLGAAVLGEMADATSIEFVYRVTAFLPLLGLLAVFLPELKQGAAPAPIPDSEPSPMPAINDGKA
jgi:FSR family fosmidomycin resistance protein-like MFS transporter